MAQEEPALVETAWEICKFRVTTASQRKNLSSSYQKYVKPASELLKRFEISETVIAFLDDLRQEIP